MGRSTGPKSGATQQSKKERANDCSWSEHSGCNRCCVFCVRGWRPVVFECVVRWSVEKSERFWCERATAAIGENIRGKFYFVSCDVGEPRDVSERSEDHGGVGSDG